MIERIIQFSINHRNLILFLTIAAAFAGIVALQKLPIDAVPDITNNQIQINTEIVALTPEQVEKQVTLPIENALKGVPGLESTRSISRDGFSQVTAIFEDGVDVYFARQQVSERLAEIRGDLPEGAEPQMGPISTGLSEIYFWAVAFDPQRTGAYRTPEGLLLTTEKEKLSYLRTVQDWIIKPQLQGIAGLAGVDAIGGYVMQVHVEPDLERLGTLKISLQDVVDAIASNNLSIGSGSIEQRGEALLVKADARMESMRDLEELIVSHRQGQPIFLKNIAKVTLGQERRTGSSSMNGQEVVIGTAMMLIGENSRKVASAVDLKLKEVMRSLPEGINITPLLNRTKLIDSTIRTVGTNLAEGALLVIAVLFAMLGNFRAAFIAACVIPLAMLITAIGMVQSEISGNLMSLGAIDFGLIVDGAIIIAENCLSRLAIKRKNLGRPLELSERLSEVALASKEMIQPSVFGQAIIIVVYLPLMSLSGIEGKMFHPMAMTVIFALVAAFILSLTFVPAMVALFVKEPKAPEKDHFAKAKQVYSHLLTWSLKHRGRVIGGASLLIALSLVLFFNLGQEFAPTLDEQDIAVQATRSPSTSLAEATKMQTHVEKALLTFPEVASVFSKTGTAEMASDPMPVDASDTFVILKKRKEWPNPKRDKMDLIDAMDEKLSKLTGNNFEFTQPIQMRFNELIAGVKSDVAVKIYGDKMELLQETGNKIAAVLKKLPGASDVVVEMATGAPQLSIDLDRSAVSRFGLNAKNVFETLQIAIGGQTAGTIYQGDRHFSILVKLPDEIRQNVNQLKGLPIPLHNNVGFVSLRELANFKTQSGISVINREQGKRMLTVEANVRGANLGTFVEHAKRAIDAKVKIPSGYWIDWGGQFTNLLSAKKRLFFVAPLCLFCIFALLCIAFQSLREALLVFSGVPLALTGGIAALFLRDMPFSISAAVGFIALSGIAVLNGIVLVSCIRQLAEKGLPLEKAISEGAVMRLRPVLMTALVASLGFLPMAFATGAGAEVQKPLATVVIGGLISSTLLTLLVLPALYSISLEAVFAFKKFTSRVKVS